MQRRLTVSGIPAKAEENVGPEPGTLIEPTDKGRESEEAEL